MEEKKCNCTNECICGCQEGMECTCDHECHCGDDCKCTSDDKCSDECNCVEHECHCHEEKDSKKDKKKKDKKEVEKLKESIKKLESDLLVSKADLVNYRKRKDEEVMRLLKFCNEDLIKQMLPIMDNFERAIKLDDNNLDDEVSKFLEGFKMIYCNMQNVMNNFDVKMIDGVNKPFDPIYHNAILMEHADDVESGIVLEVLQKGYIYKDKVIRPAMVKVSE